MPSGELRNLPSVDRVLAGERLKELGNSFSHDLLLNLTRERLEDARRSIAVGKPVPSLDEIAGAVAVHVEALVQPGLRPVINATGVILHTNLGRAPLSRAAISAMAAVSRGFSNLEFDLSTGSRGERQVFIEPLVCRLTGAEAALVVNNNAAAVLLGLSALASRKEVIVSRGQAVEIGGGFRIPDVMRQSGAKLVEVGTTNRTYIADFEQAITERTAALLRVHTSNFRVTGFTSEVTLAELVTIARNHNILVFDDLGSGCLLDTATYGLAPEPTVQASIKLGADLAFFSGDKLIGGPQAGIIAGKKAAVDRLKKHPLARAVRIDKVRLAGLAATLVHYLREEAPQEIPVWRMISASPEELSRRARRWVEALGGLARLQDGESTIGGGSLPGETLKTRLVAVGPGNKRGQSAQALSRRLRQSPVIPVIGRISEDVLLLDPRSVLPEDDEAMLAALYALAKDISK
ncbi:MAG: L-seryl-tRNA(Sec) selenium transferase [Dehalococcoidia bacterium]|nr:MAG: L-seryl-tRNA(Sec) selenium transferase [Dehalococcoidia bacterium]